MPPFIVACIVDDGAFAHLRAALGTVLPHAEFSRIEPAHLRRPIDAAALVVTRADDARLARAAGFAGRVLVCSLPPADAADAAGLDAQGVVFVAPDAGPAAMADALDAGAPEHAASTSGFDADIARTRQLLAAGEIALSLQHALNNPLTALLAEAQLLQMEAPSEEIRATAGRMLQLVRRLTELTRSLDGVRDRRGSL